MGWEGAGSRGRERSGALRQTQYTSSFLLPLSWGSLSTLWIPGFLASCGTECLAFQVSLGEKGWVGKGLRG